MAYALTSVPSLPLVDVDQRLERVRRQFRQAERMAGIGTWRLSLDDRRCEWSEQVFAIHEVDGPQPTLDAALDFYPPETRAVVAATIARTVATGEPFDLEADLITARGQRRRVRSMGEIEVDDGAPVALIGVVQDITDQYALRQRLALAAATDDLTGLANRGAFMEHLGDAITACRSRAAPLALLLIDLDGFKAVNDAFGHLAGDTVLRDMARLLAARAPDCFPARIGGDEFVIVASSEAVCARLGILVSNLLEGLQRRVRHDGRTIEVSASIGVAWLCDAIVTPTDLIARADAALYEVKRHRRGAGRVFGDTRFITGSDPRPFAVAG